MASSVSISLHFSVAGRQCLSCLHLSPSLPPTSLPSLCCAQTLEPIRVCVTGAAGQISYSLLFPICRGDVFGLNQVRMAERGGGR